MILYLQRPTIEETLDVMQRFGEDGSVREGMMTDENFGWIEHAPLAELMARGRGKARCGATGGWCRTRGKCSFR